MFINQTSYKLLIDDEKINLLENEIILSPIKILYIQHILV